MLKEPIESMEDMEANQKEFRAIAEEILQVMKKHGLKQRHVEDAFKEVKAVLGDREI